jgi:hypothetical protein
MGIDPVTKLAEAQVPTLVKAKKVEGMTLEEFDFVTNNVKEDLLVIEFKESQDSQSCILEATMQKHKHRLQVLTQTFNPDAPLSLKFGI